MTDGSDAIIQEVWAPGWTSGGYLIDGNPMNVVQGQGWFAVQVPLVQQLAAEGLIPQPTFMIMKFKAKAEVPMVQCQKPAAGR